MSKESEKKKNSVLSDYNVYVIITILYAILSGAVVYISLKYYKTNYDESKKISEIIMGELVNSITATSFFISFIAVAISEKNKTINPWIKRYLGLAVFFLFNFCRCASAINLSADIIAIVFILLYSLTVVIILFLGSKRVVLETDSLRKVLRKIRNQKIIGIQLFNVENTRAGEYDEYRFKLLEESCQDNCDLNGILSATYKIKHKYVTGMALTQLKFGSVVDSGSDYDIQEFLKEIKENKEKLLEELKEINTPEEVDKDKCCIARLFILYLTLENMLKDEAVQGISVPDGILELNNPEIEKRLFTLIRTGILGALFFGTNEIYMFTYQKDGVKSGRKYATFKIEDKKNEKEFVCLLVIKENPSQFISGDIRRAISKIEKNICEELSIE